MKSPNPADFSIRLPGTLTVKKYPGTYRSFTIGELVTPLAEFKVIDKWLEQLDAGTYEGDFWITRLEPASRNWRTRVYIEIQARIHDYRLKESDEPAAGDASSIPERDPIEDEAQAPRELVDRDVPSTPRKRTGHVTSRAAGSASTRPARQPKQGQRQRRDEQLEQLVDLFGHETAELISAGTEPVKLDPTVDRQLLRQQIHGLREVHGYTLDVEHQHWLPPAR